MIWLILVVAVVLVALTAAAVLGRVDGSLDDATTTLSHEPLPESPLTASDFADLRFDTALRGYRMNQVDGVLDRLRREIVDLDDEVTRLRRAIPPIPPASEVPDRADQKDEEDPREQPARETSASLSDRG